MLRKLRQFFQIYAHNYGKSKFAILEHPKKFLLHVEIKKIFVTILGKPKVQSVILETVNILLNCGSYLATVVTTVQVM